MAFINPAESLLVNAEKPLRDNLRVALERDNFYCRAVVKKAWPRQQTIHRIVTEGKPVKVPWAERVGCTEHTIRLQKAALESQRVCVGDMREDWHVCKVLDHVQRTFKESLQLIWSRVFRDAVIKHTARHRVLRGTLDLPIPDWGELPTIPSALEERRVNFFGKVVSPFLHKYPGPVTTNPKFAKAARQIVYFHPDTVHFMFADPENWAGKITWRNVISAECNPRGLYASPLARLDGGDIGFFRVDMDHAVQPIRSDVGQVFTIVPPGIKGFLWYWCWKLIRFNP